MFNHNSQFLQTSAINESSFYFVSSTFIFDASGQELPPIQNYTPSDYGADNQNWMISQGSNRFIYIANNRGLLQFDGSVWNSYVTPNNSVLRAVNVVGDKIYTGCYADFGFWQKNEYGTLQYNSLIPKLRDVEFEDNQIWNILDYQGWVLFQSAHKLFFYNSAEDTFKIISSENIIYKVFKVGNQMLFHVANEGIYQIKDGDPQLIISDEVVLKDRVINIFEEDNEWILVTRNSGFYKYMDGLSEWSVEANAAMRELNIFAAIQLKNGDFVLGSISNGIVNVASDGTIDFTIDQKNGLGNNTVLSLFEDQDNNVWAGLDNGITCINTDSPIKTFIDYYGELGTVYTTKIFKNDLYVGTNQGLFHRPLNAINQKFIFVNGTAGQVWSLYNNNDEQLLCGHHLGTFLIEKGSSKQISSFLGAWDFKMFSHRQDLLLQGNYGGLHILEKINGQWKERNEIKGFKNSTRFFEMDTSNTIWVNNEYKGVFSFKLDANLQNATGVKKHEELALGKTSSLTAFRDNILYASENGIFKYNERLREFSRDSTLSDFFPKKTYTSGRMSVDKTGKLWVFSKNNISYVDNNDLTNQLHVVNIPIPAHLRKGVLGFENLEQLNDESYIIGTSNGYLKMDLSKLDSDKTNQVFLNQVSITGLNEDTKHVTLGELVEFPYKKGTIAFRYSVPEYDKFQDVMFSYMLAGQSNRWSQWSESASVQFENLSFGSYDFSVKAKVGNTVTKNIASYYFKINRPWYSSNTALVVYFVMAVLIGFLVHKAYKFYYHRILKHEQIQNEKAIIQIQNEKLNQDIESKNRELAISTMSIIKKNEVLGKIKKEIKKNLEKKHIQSAIDLIDDNINNKKDWKFFKQAFNNADKDFLDKMKMAHPDLTPNDLKFCAFLRLNLSSKEIAPLLNISTKSVETKRYRLRKRLKLEHDDSLVDYILKF